LWAPLKSSEECIKPVEAFFFADVLLEAQQHMLHGRDISECGFMCISLIVVPDMHEAEQDRQSFPAGVGLEKKTLLVPFQI